MPEAAAASIPSMGLPAVGEGEHAAEGTAGAEQGSPAGQSQGGGTGPPAGSKRRAEEGPAQQQQQQQPPAKRAAPSGGILPRGFQSVSQEGGGWGDVPGDADEGEEGELLQEGELESPDPLAPSFMPGAVAAGTVGVWFQSIWCSYQVAAAAASPNPCL